MNMIITWKAFKRDQCLGLTPKSVDWFRSGRLDASVLETVPQRILTCGQVGTLVSEADQNIHWIGS